MNTFCWVGLCALLLVGLSVQQSDEESSPENSLLGGLFSYFTNGDSESKSGESDSDSYSEDSDSFSDSLSDSDSDDFHNAVDFGKCNRTVIKRFAQSTAACIIEQPGIAAQCLGLGDSARDCANNPCRALFHPVEQWVGTCLMEVEEAMNYVIGHLDVMESLTNNMQSALESVQTCYEANIPYKGQPCSGKSLRDTIKEEIDALDLSLNFQPEDLFNFGDAEILSSVLSSVFGDFSTELFDELADEINDINFDEFEGFDLSQFEDVLNADNFFGLNSLLLSTTSTADEIKDLATAFDVDDDFGLFGKGDIFGSVFDSDDEESDDMSDDSGESLEDSDDDDDDSLFGSDDDEDEDGDFFEWWWGVIPGIILLAVCVGIILCCLGTCAKSGHSAAKHNHYYYGPRGQPPIIPAAKTETQNASPYGYGNYAEFAQNDGMQGTDPSQYY